MEKVMIVTGGAQGIGKATAQHFLNQDYQVIIIDKADELSFDHPNLMYLKADLSRQVDLDKIIQILLSKYNKIDVLINNAICSHQGILSECDYDSFLETLKVGVVAPYYLTLKLKSLMSEGASIINLSSTRARQSQADTESYSAAKGGISALTHALAISLGPKIRVNAIAPGWIDTTHSTWSKADHQQHPVGRVGKPEDIVAVIEFLISDKASFISGQELVVDGGMSKLMIYHQDQGWQKQDF